MTMFDDFFINCKPESEIKPSKKRIKNNIAALRLLIENEENSITKNKLISKPLIVVIAIIIGLLVIMGATSIIEFRYDGFLFSKKQEINYYVMLSENAENAPDTIEKICYNNNVPAKYKEFGEGYPEPDKAVWQRYYDSEADVPTYLTIIQGTKKTLHERIIANEDICSPVEIKGYKGYTITHIDDISDGKKLVINEVIWDCGDYIHAVVGANMSMEELMSIIDGMTEAQTNSDN